jgi:hypothetical protein
MNNISMAILEQERNKVKSQISLLNRKIMLLEKFMSDFPDAEVRKVQYFISFIDHTDFDYETIIDNISLQLKNNA